MCESRDKSLLYLGLSLGDLNLCGPVNRGNMEQVSGGPNESILHIFKVRGWVDH